MHWLSHLSGGYSRGVVFAVAGLLALTVPIALLRGIHGPTFRTLRSAVPALAVAALAAAVVAVVLGVGMWRITPDGVSSGGSNWSDLGVHLSIAETLNSGGNFPPDVPYFSGVPLVYHWFADFHAAILAEAAGIFSVPAMVVQSAALAAALALLVFSLARRLLAWPIGATSGGHRRGDRRLRRRPRLDPVDRRRDDRPARRPTRRRAPATSRTSSATTATTTSG